MTDFVALAMGLFRVPEFRLAGGEVEPEPLAPLAMGLLEVGAAALIGIGATAAEGLISSVDVGWWWCSPGKQLRWLFE
jgi:hypothetical protein